MRIYSGHERLLLCLFLRQKETYTKFLPSFLFINISEVFGKKQHFLCSFLRNCFIESAQIPEVKGCARKTEITFPFFKQSLGLSIANVATSQ